MKGSFWTRMLDLVSPRLCAICRQRLSATESVVCATCHLHLPLTHFERMPQDNEMARRFWGIVPIERAAALFFYEPQSELSTLVYDLKYHQQPEIGEQMGRLTARQFDAAGFFQGIDAIVPVPLSRMRQWRRGYNQSMEIAHGISLQTGIPICKRAVRRTSFKESQTHLSLWQRHANINQVFQLGNERLIKGKHLLIVDDIVTTGATVAAVAEELLKADGVTISVLSLGYTKS